MESDIEERLREGLAEVRQALVRIEEKLDARHEKLEERVRTLEARMAQVWILGAASTFIVGPLIAVILHKVVS